MNSRAMTLSVIMAGIAVFFVMSSVSSIEEQTKQKFGDEVTVLVAKNDIKEQDTILDNMVEPKSVPKRFVEPSAIWFSGVVKESSDDYAMETKRLLGNVAVVPIKKGEQLSLNKITEPNLRTGLASQVTPGKRAIAIMVGETESVAKLIKPGDRVDAIAVMDMGGGQGGRENKVAKTILQDVVILAVGRYITNNLARRVDLDPASGKSKVKSLSDYDGYNSVTLELDPGQAQMIASITGGSSSKIILTLRNNDDVDRTSLSASRPTDALNDARVPAAAPAPGGAK